MALYYCLKSGRVIPPAFFFCFSFSRIALATLGLLWFHINSYYSAAAKSLQSCPTLCDYSSSVQNVMGSLIGIALNLQPALSSMTIFKK